MSEPLSLREEGKELSVTAGEVEIARYVFASDMDSFEAPKPYYHPLRTLDGALVTGYRPWDHRWHKGLQMTLSHVNDQNFWGGGTFIDLEQGYQPKENLGVQRHESFSDARTAGAGVGWQEALTWITMAGEEWFSETRRQSFSVSAGHDAWVLDFDTALTNISGKDLEIGSPTTHGRPAAGYTGLFWRGPRAFTGSKVLAADGNEDPEQIMGSISDWIAMRGQHDDVDGGATVLVFAGTSSSDVPVKWFLRSRPVPLIAPSPAYDEATTLAPGQTLELSHRFVVCSQLLEPGEIATLAADLAP